MYLLSVKTTSLQTQMSIIESSVEVGKSTRQPLPPQAWVVRMSYPHEERKLHIPMGTILTTLWGLLEFCQVGSPFPGPSATQRQNLNFAAETRMLWYANRIFTHSKSTRITTSSSWAVTGSSTSYRTRTSRAACGTVSPSITKSSNWHRMCTSRVGWQLRVF